MSGAVPLGTKLSLVVSAYSRDLPLDLHLAKCEARDEEGRVVVLLKVGIELKPVFGNALLSHHDSFSKATLKTS